MFGVSAEVDGHEIGFRQFGEVFDAVKFASGLRARFLTAHVWQWEHGLWWEIEVTFSR